MQISPRAFKRVFTIYLQKIGFDTAEKRPLKVCPKKGKVRYVFQKVRTKVRTNIGAVQPCRTARGTENPNLQRLQSGTYDPGGWYGVGIGKRFLDGPFSAVRSFVRPYSRVIKKMQLEKGKQ